MKIWWILSIKKKIWELKFLYHYDDSESLSVSPPYDLFVLIFLFLLLISEKLSSDIDSPSFIISLLLFIFCPFISELSILFSSWNLFLLNLMFLFFFFSFLLILSSLGFNPLKSNPSENIFTLFNNCLFSILLSFNWDWRIFIFNSFSLIFPFK